MFKKVVAMGLSAIMLLGMGTTVFAADTVAVPKMEAREAVTVDELIEQLNSIDFGRDVTFTALPQPGSGEQDLLEFESVEAAEEYLREFMEASSEFTTPTESFMQGGIMQQIETIALAKSSAGWCNGVVWWWGGGNTSLLSLTNAEVTFYYDGVGTMSKITVNDSYMTGIVGATWTHRRGSATELGGMDAKYSVTGTWFIGLDVFGFPVGASFDETLNSPKITMEME